MRRAIGGAMALSAQIAFYIGMAAGTVIEAISTITEGLGGNVGQVIINVLLWPLHVLLYAFVIGLAIYAPILLVVVIVKAYQNARRVRVYMEPPTER